LEDLHLTWDLNRSRKEIFFNNLKNATKVKGWIEALMDEIHKAGDELDGCNIIGLQLGDPNMKLEVHSVRPARRVGPDGQQRLDWIIEITQQRPAWFDAEAQAANEDEYYKAKGKRRELEPDFRFRGGCTLVMDAETGEVRYAIYKNVMSNHRLERERGFRGSSSNLYATYFADSDTDDVAEPFAMLHRAL
jgi:hypothetical protein